MVRIILAITILSNFYFISTAFSNEEASQGEFTGGALTSLRNPFKPQLPEPEIKAEETRDYPYEPAVQPIPTDQFMQPNDINELPKAESPTLVEMIITGLVWNSDRPQAIINGEVMGIGDKVQDAEIVAIHKTGIDVNFMGKFITINPGAVNDK